MREAPSHAKTSFGLIVSAWTAVVLLPLTVHAGWVRTFGESDKVLTGNVVNQTSDEGFIVAGGIYRQDSFPGNGPFFLLKVNSSGYKQWSRTYTRGVNETAWGVEHAEDGGYLLFCNSEIPDSPYGATWIVRTNPDGDTLWTRTLGRDTFGYDVARCLDGGYAIAGSVAGKMAFIKIDSLVNILQVSTFKQGSLKCIRKTSDEGFILGGREVRQEGTHNVYYIALVRLDTLGTPMWEKSYDWGRIDTSAIYAGNVGSVDESSDGGFFVTGYSVLLAASSGSDSTGPLIFKLDSEGELLCLRNDLDCNEAVVCGEDGSAVVSGLGLVKLDSQGNTLWRQMNGQKGLKRTFDKGYITTGLQGTELFLCKTDSLGLLDVDESGAHPPFSNLEISSAIGSEITLRYSNCSQGFRANIYDASGRKVDEIESQGESGTITWGQGMSHGVYFVKEKTDHSTTQKVVLIR